jgi:aryl-alcohol dehydrogenase-like predicted oxidoreductase
MKYNRLGRTGLFVSEICLGTMTFSGENFFGGVMGTLDQKAATRLVEKSIAAGVNFIDTADLYSAGQSEVMTGQAIRDLGVARSDVVVATKVFARVGKGINDAGASRGHIMDGVAKSLDRLKLDHIDLYQLHNTDLITPVEETMRALDDLVRQGMVRYIGASNWTAWRLMKAIGIADKQGFARLETVQAYYSIAGRDLERELVPFMTEEQVGCLVWSPLAGGYLSGKYSPDAPDKTGQGRRATFDFPPLDKARADAIVAAMRKIAHAHDTSVARVALAYVLAKPFVTSLIVGARTEAQLDDNLQATALTLNGEDMARLDEISALTPEYPHWMIERFRPQRLPPAK